MSHRRFRMILPLAVLAITVLTAGAAMISGKDGPKPTPSAQPQAQNWDMPVVPVDAPSVSQTADPSTSSSNVADPTATPGSTPAAAAPPPPAPPVRQTSSFTLKTTFLRSILSDGTNRDTPAEAGYVDTSNPNLRRVHRTLFKFEVSGLIGKQIASAKVLAPGSWGWGCTAEQSVKLQRITAAWDHGNASWFNQPPSTSANEATTKDPQGCSGDHPTYGGGWSWTITKIAQDWSTGAAANHGMLMRIDNDLARPNPWDTQYHRCFTELQLVVTYYVT